jgi:hypothetical protein
MPSVGQERAGPRAFGLIYAALHNVAGLIRCRYESARCAGLSVPHEPRLTLERSAQAVGTASAPL